MPDKIEGEIEIAVMENIIETLPQLKAIHDPSYSILIHGMGGQPRSFYRDIRQNNDVELLWTDWIGKSWWSYIFSFIPGQAGLINVLSRSRLDKLYEEIGAMSYCGLYFIPKYKLNEILETVQMKDNHIEEIMKGEPNYFLLEVDFDYFPKDKNAALFYRRVIMGENLDEKIRETLIRTE